MPRFFFDISDSRGFHRDEIGDEFPNLDEAREQCQGMLADIARENMLHGDLRSIRCDVRDETGRVVYRGELAYRETRDPT